MKAKKLSANAKKVLVLCTMVALLIVTGTLNFVLNDKLTSPTDGTDVVTTSETFFTSCRAERETARAEEFSLLEALLRAGGSPVSTGELYEKAWGEPADPAGMNTVMVHVRHLRKKLAEVDASTLYVETVWGMGYRIAKAANERR